MVLQKFEPIRSGWKLAGTAYEVAQVGNTFQVREEGRTVRVFDSSRKAKHYARRLLRWRQNPADDFGPHWVMDADNYTLEVLLSPSPPPECILGMRPTRRSAGLEARRLLQREGTERVLTRPVRTDWNPREVLLYDLRYARGSRFENGSPRNICRALCTNYKDCHNPGGPWCYPKYPLTEQYRCEFCFPVRVEG